jgi:hypothetical protein
VARYVTIVSNKLWLTARDYISKTKGQQQHKVWDLNIFQLKTHDQEVMKILHLGSLMQENIRRVQHQLISPKGVWTFTKGKEFSFTTIVNII